MANQRLRVVESLAGVPAADWNALAQGDPFVSHEFLSALIDTGCASARSGWRPQIVLLENDKKLAGAMPMFLKSHSYGEYVFDWSWADAYQRHGLEYYPKLLSAVPFTPVGGTRMLVRDPQHRKTLMAAALTLASELEVSSFHCLFPTEEEAKLFAEYGMMMRHGVQFHWTNAGYGTFDDFLRGLNHDKRKK